MTASRRKRLAFRPNLNDGPLEVRVVPAIIGTPVLRTQASLQRAFELNSVSDGQAVRGIVIQEIRTAIENARSAIRAQVAQLFANGTPTQEQRANFRASVQGILSATALQLSSMASLLPGGGRLVPTIQRSLIGSQGNSLGNRIDQLMQTRGTARALNAGITQAVNRFANQRVDTFNTFARSGTMGMLSVNQSGVSIPLSQFIGTQLVNQVSNTLGSLSQSVPTVANSVLFASDGTVDRPSFVGSFESAVGLVVFQLRNGLALAPSLAPGLTPQIQSALLDTGEDSTSLVAALGNNLATTPAEFNTAASGAFTDAFNNVSSSISTAFSLPASQTFNLSAGVIPSFFDTQVSGLDNGFFSGFGSGFPGFGVASTDFNMNFGTGFGSTVFQANAVSGFTIPTTPDHIVMTGGGPALVRS